MTVGQAETQLRVVVLIEEEEVHLVGLIIKKLVLLLPVVQRIRINKFSNALTRAGRFH
jgi:hypothetical protein